ncbi:MAG: fructokinase [Gammaproteobacteria bacterium]|nr:fructokinase [Gammaproteobacteria bacterium]
MRIGIDLGGTKIEAIALDQNGSELFRHRVQTPRNDYSATIKAITDLVHYLEQQCSGTGSVGIGIPGTISAKTGLVKNANSTWIIGKPLQQDLEQRLGRPVKIANDANCFVVSEATDGAAAGYEIVFGVIIGTGTGAGIAVNGIPLVGANSIAGEWGHNPLPWPDKDESPGADCYCGKKGCIETWLSGPGFSRYYQSCSNANLTPTDIVQLAEQGNTLAEDSIQQYEDRLARSLASVINILDPDIIVLGGGMGNIKRLYENVPRLWAKYIFSDEVNTQLVPPMHGDSSGVRGAAWLKQ